MDIIISNSAGVPIYEQICTQLKAAIMSGELSEGELLPSIRALAKDLGISVITTRRAYDELEREGFINTVSGRGCFVAAKDTELLREENLRRIDALIFEIRSLAAPLGLGTDDVCEAVRAIFEEERQ